jgi:hypothetical protein
MPSEPEAAAHGHTLEKCLPADRSDRNFCPKPNCKSWYYPKAAITKFRAVEMLDHAIEHLTKSRMNSEVEDQRAALAAADLIVALPSVF